MIDSTPLGDIPWQGFSIQYTGERPEDNVLPWMDGTYEVWFRDSEPQWKDFMSGDWVWQQADEISKDPSTHGSVFVPVILGSDKMMVSVGTGNNEYYPLYASIGNVHNNVWQQLFHASLSHILQSLKPGMTRPKIVWFGDGHFWKVIYDLGPHIADYEEQVVLAGIVHNWCPKCLSLQMNLDAEALLHCCEHTDLLVEELEPDQLWDEYGIIDDVVPFMNDFLHADIHQLLSPDLLHQLIKGTFKDHLVNWVEKYILLMNSKRDAEAIMSDIDRHIAAVAPFTGLRCFPKGRGFKQWTGDDSKALMKVYLPAIEGHVPTDIVRTFCAFLEFCYIARRNVITEDSLAQLEDALDCFHHYCTVFQTTNVVVNFSLPHQHSMMLKTNERLDKIAASRVDFKECGMLEGTLSIRCTEYTHTASDPQCEADAALGVQIVESQSEHEVREVVHERKRAHTVSTLAEEINVPHLKRLIHYFLFLQIHPNDPQDLAEVPIDACPRYDGKIKVFNSAATAFFTPSDPSGIGGMRREHIRACLMWQGMRGLEIAQVLCFLSFVFEGEVYLCAVVHWFNKVADEADEDMGMWIVQPGYHDIDNDQEHHLERDLAVIHINTVYRMAHLISLYGNEFISKEIKHFHSYNTFNSFYVNKYADHHTFEIAF
ncbi:hypothetical protein BDN67DRAFT_985983 [Paxillus ammoniavirescens]|nr:hypothetical protein BDN67DRAFT_985983 [Paxillus ammoniavirescens]